MIHLSIQVYPQFKNRSRKIITKRYARDVYGTERENIQGFHSLPRLMKLSQISQLWTLCERASQKKEISSRKPWTKIKQFYMQKMSHK